MKKYMEKLGKMGKIVKIGENRKKWGKKGKIEEIWGKIGKILGEKMGKN